MIPLRRPTRRDTASRPQGRFATRRKLIAVFSAVLVVFASAVGAQFIVLHHMEAQFSTLHDHENEMRAVLYLEDYVRDQLAYAEDIARGESLRIAQYEEAHAGARALIGELGRSVDEPEAIAWLKSIRRLHTELDEALSEELISNARSAASPPPSDERSVGLASRIQRHCDGLFTFLQDESSEARTQQLKLQQAAVRWTGMLLILGPILCTFAVLYLSRSVARPLATLSASAAAVAAGDLSARIELHSRDEFGALATDLNAMTSALRKNQEKLVESEKLAGMGRLAAGMAHELNNPLQVMLGYLSLHREHPDPRLSEHLAAIEDETMRCKELVDGLLELARPLSIATACPVDVRAVCEDIRRSLHVLLPTTHAELTITGAGLAQVDPTRLRQAIFNLMKNAIEAAGPAGAVGVEIAAAGASLELSVSDSGPGITSEARARLFEPFYTTKPSGTGIGLAVSRAIVRSHGGDITVANRISGGAVFTIRVPRALDHGMNPT